MRFLLDTNAISELLADPGGPVGSRYLANLGACFTSIIVAAELRYGMVRHPARIAARDAAALLAEFPIVPFESPADEHYGSLRASLAKSGKPIGGNDLLIAAHALALNATLVTANEREFRRVPDLKIENWAA